MTMKLKYILKQNDYLQYYLYDYSQTTSKMSRYKSIAVFAGIFFFASLLSALSNNYFVAAFFLLSGVGIMISGPSGVKRKIFAEYLKISKQRSNEVTVNILLNDDSIEVSTQDIEIKHNIKGLEKMSEVKTGFYLKFKNDVIIIPKSEEVDVIQVRNELLNYASQRNIEFVSNLNWKW